MNMKPTSLRLLMIGPDGALYTSNWGISSAPGDGEVLRIGL